MFCWQVCTFLMLDLLPLWLAPLLLWALPPHTLRCCTAAAMDRQARRLGRPHTPVAVEEEDGDEEEGGGASTDRAQLLSNI